MPILIPIDRTADDDSHFDLQVVLEETTYTLEFLWNERMQSWFMNIWDADEVINYAAGIRLVADYLLRQYTVDRTPPGDLALIDTATDDDLGIDPGFDDLGIRHQLYYYTAEEIGE